MTAKTRDPEEMPTEWRIKSFAGEKGLGTLVHSSGEEVMFDITVWDLGSWEPTRQEAIETGTTSALLPREGEPVQVRWKRSSSGKNLPAQVQPTGRVSRTRKQYTLDAWLEGVQRVGKFTGLTSAALIEALGDSDKDAPGSWGNGEPRNADNFGFLLLDIDSIYQTDPAWVATHADWIYADDHRWWRDRARKRLPDMIGLTSAPEPDDGDESLPEYVARCNAEAERSGTDLRLHEVLLDGDAHVFVAMTPAAFAALVADEYLAVW